MHRIMIAATRRTLTIGALTILAVASLLAGSAFAADEADVGLFDPDTGRWHLRDAPGSEITFFYGAPGDVPLFGDWDCDGVDTVGMYRPSNGFVYIRNSNDFGVADQDFFFGIAGDVPLVGDWNGDGCDTLAVYRNGRVFIANTLGTVVGEFDFFFGIPGDRPFSADFNGDGITTVGVYREASGFAYFRDTLDTGAADFEFFYGIPSDRIIAGDWDGNVTETVGIFRPSLARFFLSNVNAQVAAEIEFEFGQSGWLPVAGVFAPSPTELTVDITTPAISGLSFAATFDGGTFTAEVSMAATVFAPDGAPATVTWSSDLDGVLGTGETLTATLSAGPGDVTEHIITATAISASGEAVDTVRVLTVIPSN